MNNVKKLFLYSLIAIFLVSAFHSQAHAQASCSTITSDAQYLSCKCTGQSAQDSLACQKYATADANAQNSTQCANITNDTIYEQCCNGDSNDSVMCVAYNNDPGQPSGNPTINATNPGSTKITNGQNTKTVTPATGAQNAPLNISLQNPLSNISTIPDAINKILSVIIRIALPLIIIFFIWSGLTFIFARGNPTEVTKAKQMFLYTIIGTLLILGAWVITNAIIGTVNAIIS